MPLNRLLLPLLLTLLPALATQATPFQITDATGQTLTLQEPARRIISLAPHITENLFAIGAGDLLIGVVTYSDYPEAATRIPIIGSYNQLDVEGILSMQPDVVIAWHSGNSRIQIEQLQQLGIRVYFSEPRSFAGLAEELRRLGQLTGQQASAAAAALALEQRVQHLQHEYGDQRPVRVFYQVWEQPLMTVNKDHLIHEAITLCRGENVFAELPQLIPRIDRESVLAENPEVIAGGGMGEDNPAWIEYWRRFADLRAVRENKLYFIPPSLLQRATPRLLDGTELLCRKLQQAREQG